MMDNDNKKEKEYEPVSDYPVIERTVSVLVPSDANTTDVEDIINGAGGEFLIDSDLSDMYDAPDLGEGSKKEFVFKLFFQARDRAVTDDEVDKIMLKIKSDLTSFPSWEVK